MLLIVGLGNPGQRYEWTRHNIGFRVADRLAERYGGTYGSKFSGDLAFTEIGGQRAALLKPMTYMNDSGRCVAQVARFYKWGPSEILVVHDELDLPFAEIRLKKGGGEAGHNGLRSLSRHLGTRDFCRLRIGIGKPPPDFRGDGADFVLRAFSAAEREQIPDILDRAVAAVALVAERGLGDAMSVTNRRDKSE